MRDTLIREIVVPTRLVPIGSVNYLLRYKDMGATMAIGKIEQGRVDMGMKCVIQPVGKKCALC